MLRWQKFTRLGTRFVTLWESLLPVKRCNSRCTALSNPCHGASSAIRPSHRHNVYLHQPINLPYKEKDTRDIDPFAAQLRACRDQGWWNSAPPPEDTESESQVDHVSGDTPQVDITPKRSLSIREIRKRMDSDRRSTASSNSSGSYVFVSGLKLLDTTHGGWEDMETFLD
jgi:hypothetical protein